MIYHSYVNVYQRVNGFHIKKIVVPSHSYTFLTTNIFPMYPPCFFPQHGCNQRWPGKMMARNSQAFTNYVTYIYIACMYSIYIICIFILIHRWGIIYLNIPYSYIILSMVANRPKNNLHQQVYKRVYVYQTSLWII